MDREPELAACIPHPVHSDGFNPDTVLPYGLTVGHVFKAMKEFNDFLGFINQQLYTKEYLGSNQCLCLQTSAVSWASS